MENKITIKAVEVVPLQMDVHSLENKSKDGNSSISIDDISNECQSQLNELMEQQKKNNNQFPIEVFPKIVQSVIIDTNENLNYPIDFISGAILYASSLAIGNTHRVSFKKEWTESAVIFIVMIGKAGTNKSHPLSFALKPIERYDNISYKEYQRKHLEYVKIETLSKKERAEQGIDDPVKPSFKKFIVSDFTQEALAEVHKCNLRGITAYNDEIAGFFKNFNRYKKGSEMEFWLSAWSGKPIKIDRKSGEPIFIPYPFISIGGTIQNGLLSEIAKEGRTENGFLDRILFVYPEDIKKEYWSDTDINEETVAIWDNVISKMLELNLEYDDIDNPKPIVLEFSVEAKNLLFEWQKTNTDQCNNQETEVYGSIYSKLDIYILRFSLILEILSYACGESNKEDISDKSVKGAISIINYFKRTAEKVYSITSNLNPLEKYPLNKRHFYEDLDEEFTTSEGIALAEKYGIYKRTFLRFLKDQTLFQKLIKGNYKKML
jgi:hypothetical protein